MINLFKNNFLAIGAVLLLLASLRLFPHPANFTPVGAIAILGGYFFSRYKWALWIPVIIMFLSDLALEISYRLGYARFAGFNDIMVFVYPAFLLMAFCGSMAAKKSGWAPVVGATLAGSLLFFIITNFGYWVFYMPKTGSALVQSYVQAIPFFKSTLAGDLFYTGTGFLLISLWQRKAGHSTSAAA